MSNVHNCPEQCQDTLAIDSPSCDVRNNESLLLEKLQVLVGRGPHAQSVICMVDEVYLSKDSVDLVRSDGAANTVLPSMHGNSAMIVSHTIPAYERRI